MGAVTATPPTVRQFGVELPSVEAALSSLPPSTLARMACGTLRVPLPSAAQAELAATAQGSRGRTRDDALVVLLSGIADTLDWQARERAGGDPSLLADLRAAFDAAAVEAVLRSYRPERGGVVAYLLAGPVAASATATLADAGRVPSGARDRLHLARTAAAADRLTGMLGRHPTAAEVTDEVRRRTVEDARRRVAARSPALPEKQRAAQVDAELTRSGDMRILTAGPDRGCRTEPIGEDHDADVRYGDASGSAADVAVEDDWQARLLRLAGDPTLPPAARRRRVAAPHYQWAYLTDGHRRQVRPVLPPAAAGQQVASACGAATVCGAPPT